MYKVSDLDKKQSKLPSSKELMESFIKYKYTENSFDESFKRVCASFHESCLKLEKEKKSFELKIAFLRQANDIWKSFLKKLMAETGMNLNVNAFADMLKLQNIDITSPDTRAIIRRKVFDSPYGKKKKGN